ncbi:MAG: bacillithiol biosynthesis deacetylase BshB1, partial [Planctomycetota bacterium]
MSDEGKVGLLVFGAHPDDIEFGCGGVVAGETARGVRVGFVICSRGEAGTNGTPEERTAEATAAASILGATLHWHELGGDAHFERRVEHAIGLAALIRRLRPATVLAPSVVENQHPDHAVLGKLVRDAARLARYGGLADLKGVVPHSIGQLLFYAVTPDAEPRDITPLLVDVSEPKVVDVWTRAMQAHASQMKTRNYAE